MLYEKPGTAVPSVPVSRKRRTEVFGVIAFNNSYHLSSGRLLLDCDPNRSGPPHIMGILNVTPDSFSDGGDFLDPSRAAKRAEEMINEGAVIIDVGGASTRPRGSVYGEGAAVLSAEQEIGRVVPVIESIARQFPNIWISVDTYSPDVARKALQAGAHIINDITGLRGNPTLADVAAGSGAPMILMHSVGQPGEMPHTHEYDDVVCEVKRSLSESISIAEAHGVTQIVVDPGFGFGKTERDNLRLINGLDSVRELDRPVMVGISRKNTIGAVLAHGDEPVAVEERLYGSLGATAVAVLRGASIIRTHDVRETTDMLKLMSATLEA